MRQVDLHMLGRKSGVLWKADEMEERTLAWRWIAPTPAVRVQLA